MTVLLDNKTTKKLDKEHRRIEKSLWFKANIFIWIFKWMYFYCIPSLLGSLSINMLVNELYKQEYLLKANFREWVFNCSPKANSKPNFNTNFTLSDTIWAHLAHLNLLLLTQLPVSVYAKGNSPELQVLSVQLCLPLLPSSALWYSYGVKNNMKLITILFFKNFFNYNALDEARHLRNS